jgi:HK97 family phage major capsid protein
MMYRTPSAISEDIRKLDVSIADLEHEHITLAARDQLTDGEAQRFEQIGRAIEHRQRQRADLEHEHRAALEAAVSRDAQLDEIRTAAGNPGSITHGDDRGPTLVTGRTLSDRQLFGSEPTFAGTSSATAIRAATRVLERADDFAENVDPDAVARIGELAERGDEQSFAARWTLSVADPNYQAALEKTLYGARPDGQLRWTDAERVAYLRAEEVRTTMSTTLGNGGALVPFALDPTIILSNTGSISPFRQISRVVSTVSSPWHGVTSAGSSGEWASELAEVTDASPTFTQPSIPAFRGDCHVEASLELLADSNISSQLGTVLADARANLEATAFATGNGTTAPKGIVTALSAVTASRVASTTNAAFGSPDLFALVDQLPARWQDRASWLAHWSIYNRVRSFTSSASPAAGNFWTDLGNGTPPNLLGAPAHKASAMTSTLSSATASTDYVLVLGDFSQYVIVDALGSTIVHNPVVLGSNRRPIGAQSWTMFFRTGADVTVADAFRILQV